jgi:(1->4)-alpha-D-glucan 1-alpha-D-glucosylmutase
MHDGRLKLYVTWRLLQLRRQLEDLFRDSDYSPLRARGPHARHICSFERRQADARVIVIAPRWFARLAPAGQAPVGEAVWHGTALDVPPGDWVNVLTGESVPVGGAGEATALAAAFTTLPWAVLAPAASMAAAAKRGGGFGLRRD